MKKSFWTIALSLILFVTACGAKPVPAPANGTLVPMIMKYKVDLTNCWHVASDIAIGWEWPHPTDVFPGPQIVVYTNKMPLIIVEGEPGAISISLPEYYWTDVYQDQRIPPIVNGPFSAINTVMIDSGDICVVTWQNGEYPVNIKK